MGAFYGGCIIAFAIIVAVSSGIEPHLKKIVSALENKNNNDKEV